MRIPRSLFVASAVVAFLAFSAPEARADSVLIREDGGGASFLTGPLNSFYNSLTGTTSSLTTTISGNLSFYDLIVVSLPLTPLSTSELGALSSFLSGGGRVAFIGEHGFYAPEANNRINAAIAALGGSMSLTNTAFDGGLRTTVAGQILNHPLTQGVNTVEYGAPSGIAGVTGGNAFFLSQDLTQVWGAEEAVGGGSIVLLGDSNLAPTSFDNGTFYQNLLTVTSGALPPDTGGLFAFFQNIGSGMMDGDGTIAWSWLGSVAGDARFPGNEFLFAESYNFDGLVVNQDTTYTLFGAVNAPGQSPHTYTGEDIVVSPAVQAALVAGVEALMNQTFDFEAFPMLVGFMQPGDLAFITPSDMIAFFAQYIPIDPDLDPLGYQMALDELTQVVFLADPNSLTFTEDGASAGGEDILFPHQPFTGISLQVQFSLPPIDPDTGRVSSGVIQIATQVIPEPGSIALVVVGLAGAAVLRRRRRAA